MSSTASQANARHHLCLDCNKSYTTAWSLTRHLNASPAHVHPSIPCTVAGCAQMFYHNNHFRRHLYEIHDIVSTSEYNGEQDAEHDPVSEGYAEPDEEGNPVHHTGTEEAEGHHADNVSQYAGDAAEYHVPGNDAWVPRATPAQHQMSAAMLQDSPAEHAAQQQLLGPVPNYDLLANIESLITANDRLKQANAELDAGNMALVRTNADLHADKARLARLLQGQIVLLHQKDVVIARLANELEEERRENRGHGA